MKNVKLDCLLRFDKAPQTVSDFYKSVPVKHLSAYKKAYNELVADGYVAPVKDARHLSGLTKEGRDLLFSWQTQLAISKRETRHFWISTTVSIIALILSGLALHLG